MYDMNNNDLNNNMDYDEQNCNNMNNTDNTNRQRRKNKKKASWIPLAAVGTGLVAVIVAISLIAASVVRNDFADPTSQSGTESVTQTAISDASTTSLSNATVEGGTTITDVSDVVSTLMPAVVSITSRSVESSYGYGMFGMNSSDSTENEVDSGVGSGTIVGQNSKELLILTSYHVVEDCSSLYVTFCDDSAVDGYIKDIDSDHDIAIVAVRLSDISDDTMNNIAFATLSSETPECGEGVIVIGDALGEGQSVVTGVVSALNREITVEDKTVTVIQTDAAINAGNSGGCMLNANGEIIGISEAKISSSSVEGMCYAISVQYYYDTIVNMLNEDPLDDSEISAGDTNSEEETEDMYSQYGMEFGSGMDGNSRYGNNSGYGSSSGMGPGNGMF